MNSEDPRLTTSPAVQRGAGVPILLAEQGRAAMGVSSTIEDTPQKRESSTAMMVTTAIVAGTLPALVGLVLLGSNALKCPLLTRPSRCWWTPSLGRVATTRGWANG
jgi:hypothetical protein